MAESLFLRVRRLLSATAEDAVDRLEQSGSDAVMREAVREVDRAIDDVRATREAAAARRLHAARQQKLLRERAGQLGEKAQFALGENREDLAEAAVSRQLDFEKQALELDEVQALAADEEAKLDDNLATLMTRKQQMEESLRAYETAQREAAIGEDGSGPATRDAEKQVDRAEQAFDRAMRGVGGVGFTRADAETINRVTELDGLSKSAAVKARLAAMKQAAA